MFRHFFFFACPSFGRRSRSGELTSTAKCHMASTFIRIQLPHYTSTWLMHHTPQNYRTENPEKDGKFPLHFGFSALLSRFSCSTSRHKSILSEARRFRRAETSRDSITKIHFENDEKMLRNFSLTRRWTSRAASVPSMLGISCFRFAFLVRHGPYLLKYWVWLFFMFSGEKKRVETELLRFPLPKHNWKGKFSFFGKERGGGEKFPFIIRATRFSQRTSDPSEKKEGKRSDESGRIGDGWWVERWNCRNQLCWWGENHDNRLRSWKWRAWVSAVFHSTCKPLDMFFKVAEPSTREIPHQARKFPSPSSHAQCGMTSIDKKTWFTMSDESWRGKKRSDREHSTGFYRSRLSHSSDFFFIFAGKMSFEILVLASKANSVFAVNENLWMLRCMFWEEFSRSSRPIRRDEWKIDQVSRWPFVWLLIT